MAFHYLYPTISALPAGYDCTIVLPVKGIADRIAGNGAVSCRFTVFFEGEDVFERVAVLNFENGKLVGETAAPFVWKDGTDKWGDRAGFIEFDIRSVDDREIFSTKRVLGFYSIYSKPGKKSFFSDNAYKFAAPPVINQIAAYQRFVDGYPVIHLDRDRDLGETVTLINPYKKPVLVQIHTCDGRRPVRQRVPPLSARLVRLAGLLDPQERSWMGQIQLTANNRLVTYHVRHSLKDPQIISDHEHFDPYRGDPTHLPATQWLRQAVGRIFVR